MNQAADSDRGEKTADNIRYGQNISESGQGGMTEGMGGDAADGMLFLFAVVDVLGSFFVFLEGRRRVRIQEELDFGVAGGDCDCVDGIL